MAKIKKQFLTPKWLEIKTMYEEGTNGSDKYGTNFPVKGELNELSNDFFTFAITFILFLFVYN